jgi:hypothetical protein
MSKCLVLYGTKNKLTPSHKRISNSKQPPYYVRVETVLVNVATALRRAKAMNGEIVLNAVSIDDEERQ